MTYRVLVTGSRTWYDTDRISFELGLAIGQSGRSLEDVVIVHGDCPRGADRIAKVIALSYRAGPRTALTSPRKRG